MPAGWEVERAGRRLTAARGDGHEATAVTTFRLRRPFRADLWDEAVAELELVARDLAAQLSPTARLAPGRDATIAGRRARVYEIRYERAGVDLLERTAFLFAGRREYQLTCRIEAEQPQRGEGACGRLFASFSVRG